MEPLWDIYISTFDRKSIEPPYSKDFFMALPELGEKLGFTQQRKMTDDWWGLQPYYCKANALTTMFLETPMKGFRWALHRCSCSPFWRSLRRKATRILIGALLTCRALPTSSYLLEAKPCRISLCITSQSGSGCLKHGNKVGPAQKNRHDFNPLALSRHLNKQDYRTITP